jgi:flagellar biosynthesis protein FlhB
MAEDSDLEKTEPASGRKLQKARDEGNVPRSRELSTLAVLLASGASLWVLGVFLFDGLRRMMRDQLSFTWTDASEPEMLGINLFTASLDALWIFLPIGGIVLLAAVGANVAISGWVFTLSAVEAKFGKLNPISGLGRMFSTQSLAELIKALLKGVLIAGVSGWMIWVQHDAILGLVSEPLNAALPHFARIVMFTFFAAVSAFALVALIDVPYQLWEYHRKLRMTKEEVRQEGKETEGDPQIKARVRSMQREMARRLAAPILIILILAMMVLPLPPFVLDMLFTFNIALSVMVMLVACTPQAPLEFSVFPTVLLVTTLLRLSLNVASTRVVLLQGHTGPDAAGKVIEAFGHFLVGGNYAVGIMVFADPGGHQLHRGHQGRRPHRRGQRALHPGCHARQADGHRCRPERRADRRG